MTELFKNHDVPFEIFMAVIVVAVIWILLVINRLAFKKLQDRQNGLHLIFFRKFCAVVIIVGGIILAFSLFGGLDEMWKMMLGGTAIISALVAIAAQDVIDDILSGMMISLYKPFEIGNRIELEDGTAGIVKDITMRHVVIHAPFNEVVIPNSRINTMSIKNYSYHIELRSFLATFHVAYNTDVEKAIKVVREAVMKCKGTIPGIKTEHGEEYAPVYFMAYEDSSLRFETRVFFLPDVPSEVVISDVNIAVNKALRENGIEIPYPYINIVKH
ncbi:MAG: mechanosensitive ion channel [Eubacterium sp.]|nr:mechanosensitive ion channel [Eubacterium sp.]